MEDCDSNNGNNLPLYYIIKGIGHSLYLLEWQYRLCPFGFL